MDTDYSVAIAAKTQGGWNTVLIEEEIAEQTRLNHRADKNRAKRERMELAAAQMAAQDQAIALAHQEAERRKERAKMRRATRFVFTELALCAVAGAALGAFFLGLMNLWLPVAVASVCVCATCYRAGKWFGRRGKE